MLTLWFCDFGTGGSALAQNIQFTPGALSLTVAKGGTVSGTLSLKKSDTAQHTYFISANQSWIWLNPPYGSTQTISTETDVLTVTVNTAAMGLAAGTYSGTIYIGQAGPGVSTTWRIPVTTTVTATGTTPPPPRRPPFKHDAASAPTIDHATTAALDDAAPSAAADRLIDAHAPGLPVRTLAHRREGNHCIRRLQPAEVQYATEHV
jgi:hypothetical protein